MRGAPKADFRRSSAGSIRAAPCRSAVALPVGATSNASSSESRPCANARPDDCEDLQDRRNPAVELDKEPAIIVRGPDATMQPTPQDHKLMSNHRVLSFNPNF